MALCLELFFLCKHTEVGCTPSNFPFRSKKVTLLTLMRRRVQFAESAPRATLPPVAPHTPHNSSSWGHWKTAINCSLSTQHMDLSVAVRFDRISAKCFRWHRLHWVITMGVPRAISVQNFRRRFGVTQTNQWEKADISKSISIWWRNCRRERAMFLWMNRNF